AGNFHRATGASGNVKTEAMQFDDRGNHAQAEAQAFDVSAFVRAIEALGDGFPLCLGDAGSRVTHADDGLALRLKQCELHAPAFGSEFHGVVDQIGNGLEQQVAVAAYNCTIGRFDVKADTLVFGDRIVEIARFANESGELDLAKPFAPATVLDFRNAQQRRDGGQRLVEAGDRLIGNGAQFLQRCGVLAAALEAYAHAGEWRAQIMRDVVAYHLRLLQGFLQQRRAHRSSYLPGYPPVTEETSFRIKQGLATRGNIDFGAVPAS